MNNTEEKSLSELEQAATTKKRRGKEKLYSKIISFPDYPTANDHIVKTYTNYRFRYEKGSKEYICNFIKCPKQIYLYKHEDS